jgi:hypothetical protein
MFETMRNSKVLIMLSIAGLLLIAGCTGKTTSTKDASGLMRKTLIKVPHKYPTIAQAVLSANAGDTIIIFPGLYKENSIEINKTVTISSEWKLTGEVSKIDETVIDAEDQILFSVKSDGVEISGLKVINGDHTLDITANVTIKHNHFINNSDAMSFESGSGGYAGYNTVENDRDDGIDIDIGGNKNNIGSDIIVENNTIINSDDDGIEIRLYTQPGQNINYNIRGNKITGSNNAAIQLISYDVYTGKIFHIHHNIFVGCKNGLGCMEGSNTSEDLSGASKMDEQIFFYNNTIVNNQMGATGGNNIIALNNVVEGNALGGFKRFGRNSSVINNLFYQNGDNDFIELNDAVIKSGNILFNDPLLDKNTFTPAINSPCVNTGMEKYELNGIVLLKIDSKYIVGAAPDIGAIEYKGGN